MAYLDAPTTERVVHSLIHALPVYNTGFRVPTRVVFAAQAARRSLSRVHQQFRVGTGLGNLPETAAHAVTVALSWFVEANVKLMLPGTESHRRCVGVGNRGLLRSNIQTSRICTSVDAV